MASNRENLNTSSGNAQKSAVSYTGQAPHTSGDSQVLQRGAPDIPVTEQEDEAFERLMRLAGVHE